MSSTCTTCTSSKNWRYFDLGPSIDVENRYVEKVGICEDVVEEMRIEIEGNDDSDNDGNEMMDRQLIDRALQ